MTAALEGGEWSAARPGRILPPGENWYPLYRRLGGPQGRSGRAENLVPTGIRSPERPARGDRGGTMVKVLFYKSEGRWFDPRWCHWKISLT